MIQKYMLLAFEEAEKARGLCSPNPFVGAVIVKDDVLISQAHTQSYGSLHAEAMALQLAGEQAKGADLYVTLEPCSHYGKTPPCTKAIIEAGINRVFFGIRDPNPKVNEDVNELGSGIKSMMEAGIELSWGYMEKEITRQNEYYLCRIVKGRPFVTLKMALSLDGKFASEDGSSRWISSAASRRQVHQLRQEVDCILVGISTVLADDPLLTSRLPLVKRQPSRVVLDKDLQIPINCALIKSLDSAQLMVFHAPELDRHQLMKAAILRNMGVELIPVGTENSHLRLPKVLENLHQKGFYSVLLESGGALASEFLRLQLVDKLLIHYGSKVIGGGNAALSSLKLGHISNAIKLDIHSCKFLDGDLVVEAYL